MSNSDDRGAHDRTARDRARGIALLGGSAFDWPPGTDTATQVAIVQLMLLTQTLAATGHGDLAVKATAHALQAGGYEAKGRV